MNNNQRGSKAEREFVDILGSRGLAVVKAGGSGVNKNTWCDVVAGKKGRCYVFELKMTKNEVIYITREQISKFLEFASLMGATPFIGVKFFRTGWYLLEPHQLVEAKSYWKVEKENTLRKGLFIDFWAA